MTILELLVLFVVAGIVGSIGQATSGYSDGGCFTAVAVGFVGSLFGTWMARGFGLPELFMLQVGGVAFPIVWALIGATLFVAVIAFLGRSGARSRSRA